MSKQVYAIFGASGGIGSCLSELIAKLGHTVYLLGRNEEKLKSLSQKLSQPYLVVDPLSEASVDSVLSSIVKNGQSLDGVASCIGSFYVKPMQMTSLKDFEDVIRVNLFSSFCILKSAAHLMAEKRRGSIVLCSSTAALTGLASHEAISSAKGAISSLVRSAAASYAPKGVRINAVAPGLTRTPLSHALTSNEAVLKASTAFHPLGRIGEPEDIAQGIFWLLSDQSSWVTAETLAIDGGLSSLKVKN
jgi:NAD(P)-dependent dehydrogenase (short-subunit alcohol dehydrogenase family)